MKARETEAATSSSSSSSTVASSAASSFRIASVCNRSNHSQLAASSSSPSPLPSSVSSSSFSASAAARTLVDKQSLSTLVSFLSSPSVTPIEEPVAASREGGGQESVTIERRGEHSAICKWTVHNFPKVKARALWSRYFQVGSYDCRLLVYPKGDTQSLPGYASVYVQIMDPRSSPSSKWDCFASYRLSVVNQLDDSKSVHRDSFHRFSSKKKSHGWCDFTPSSTLVDARMGFLNYNDSVVITADITILKESTTFTRDNELLQSGSSSSSSSTLSSACVSVGPTIDVLTGRFVWKVHNFSLFKEMIKTQKIMSPSFPAGECNLRISVYQSSVNGVEHLSMCLESKDAEKLFVSDRSCWCLFRMSVLNQKAGTHHIHRDSYGRFAADFRSGDTTSLGWTDYMKMSEFMGKEKGFLADDTAVFSASFNVIKESSSFTKIGGSVGGRSWVGGRKSDGHFGKFTWRIENFTRLKDLLKKRKITGLCVKSKRFQVGNRDCRLIIYPRGQSQPPCHLSVFLEVTDLRNTISDWNCFVSHRLSLVNQKMEDKSIMKESQNRYSKAAKDWGWREFVTLTNLFDQDSGFIVQDTVTFSAEVLILKETSIMQESFDQDMELNNAADQTDVVWKKGSFTWKVENFVSFKDIMETRKIFSKFFQAGGCELRIGVYESFDTICIYLESDQSVQTDPDKNFWVKYRMTVLNQKYPDKAVSKESSICTKMWNNSVLQFMKVSDMLEADAGFLLRDTIVFVCDIIDWCPWFDFSDLEVLAYEDDGDVMSTVPDESNDSEGNTGRNDEKDYIFRNLLSGEGFDLSFETNSSQPQVMLREKLHMDAGAIADILTKLRGYLDDPANVQQFLLPTNLSSSNNGERKDASTGVSSPSVLNMLMGVKVLQPAIIDSLLDIMVRCCQPSEETFVENLTDIISKPSANSNGTISLPESSNENGPTESVVNPLHERSSSGTVESTRTYAVQSSDTSNIGITGKASLGQSVCPQAPSAVGLCIDNSSIEACKTKWPEQSEELLRLIVSSLKDLDGAGRLGCLEAERRSHSSEKIILVLDKAPKHLVPDLVSLVPRLVDRLEHPTVARALLGHLNPRNGEPNIRVPIAVMEAIGRLEFGHEVWKSILRMSYKMLKDPDGKLLAASMGFILHAASCGQELPEAVRVVRSRLERLGAEVSSWVLKSLSLTMNVCADVAEAVVRDIHSNFEVGETCLQLPFWDFPYSESGVCGERSNAADGQVLNSGRHFCDTYMLIDILSVPGLAVEACQAFERAIEEGAITHQLVAMVLERRHARKLRSNSSSVTDDTQQQTEENIRVPVQDGDFIPVLGLVETLALSTDSRVQGFVSSLYVILVRMYADDGYHRRLLKGLIDRVTNPTNNCRGVALDLDILVTLVFEEEGIARQALSMIQEVAELANVDRAALWRQLCASEDENTRIREERQAEYFNMVKEKDVLALRLSEVEATANSLKSETRAEMDRFSREKKDLSKKLQDAEDELEWLRSERHDEITKLRSEKKVLQDRLNDVETQLLQLSSRKRDELKRVTKEKNLLAERLRSAEAVKKRCDEESKRHAAETIARLEVRNSLEAEVRRLTKKVGEVEEEKREKEEQVSRCETYIDGMEAKLRVCQQYVNSLESSLQEEMSRHAPLYGAGLEALSMGELDTLSRIHEDGLRQIRVLQQQKGNAAGSQFLMNPHSHVHNHGAYSASPSPVAVGQQSPATPNGGSRSVNNVLKSSVRPWFNRS